LTIQEISRIKKQIEEINPLVHCITNIVTVNDCANVLLALGASPTMAHHPLEVEDVASNSNALVLNMGAMESLDAMVVAGKAAKSAGIPIVLDPVGAGGATYRRNSTLSIIDEVRPDCIRGNRSELMALCKGTFTQMGVDSHSKEEVSIELLRDYSKAIDAILVVSGETDIIISGDEVTEVRGGSKLMSKITGAGCMATSLLGAFLAYEKSLESVEACCMLFKECASRAENITYQLDRGTMNFRMNLIDEIFKF